ncbi:MAG: hypothetical protein Q7T36_11670 [Fluviicoccus sp.]|uniref:hypothetical protein n=1 Tax=Fluviicoccus sp. TaxID=2003552 RepID=UPI002716239F|nr:hypothetical protein [Fluviicoccus sp.]MDO8331117.1 hypothetical protein [Fluviicoccus sp.]
MTPVIVNHKEIPEAVIGQEMQYHPAQSRQEAWQRAAEALVLRELLLQEAHREAVAQIDNDEAELIDSLLARVIRVDAPGEEACREFYAAQAHRLLGPDGQTLPYDDVALIIRGELEARSCRQAVTVYLQKLVAGSNIRGIQMGKTWLPVISMN